MISEQDVMKLRPATPDDAAAIAALHVALWRGTYRDLMPDALLDGLSIEQRTRFWRDEIERLGDQIVVATDGAALRGFVSFGRTINPWPGYDHEIYTLYVDTQAQGRGVGRALLRTACGQLQRDGAHNLVIWALAGAPANQFYARHGGKLLVTRPFRYGDHDLEETGYGWDTIRMLIG